MAYRHRHLVHAQMSNTNRPWTRSRTYRYPLQIDQSLCADLRRPIGRSSGEQGRMSPRRARQIVRLHLDNPAHITITVEAQCAIERGVPQAACPDSTMKAATCVPTVDARAAFYIQSIAFFSDSFDHARTFKLTDSERIGQRQPDPRKFSKATIPRQTGRRSS